MFFLKNEVLRWLQSQFFFSTASLELPPPKSIIETYTPVSVISKRVFPCFRCAVSVIKHLCHICVEGKLTNFRRACIIIRYGNCIIAVGSRNLCQNVNGERHFSCIGPLYNVILRISTAIYPNIVVSEKLFPVFSIN